MFLVIMETSGNQRYIFSTNKLRENVGASELTYQSCTGWVAEAVLSRPNTGICARQSKDLLRGLCDPSVNPPIESNSSENAVEVVLAVSGKAYILTKKEEDARCLIGDVTERALREAPGLDIAGAYVEFDWNGNAHIHDVIKNAYLRLSQVRSHLPGPEAWFLRIPLVDVCATSGLPASHTIKVAGEPRRVSSVTKAKRDVYDGARGRLKELLLSDNREFPPDPDKMTQGREGEWLAVIHADGNGLGQVFLDFKEKVGDACTNRDYIDTLRNFSIALDRCTVAACRTALDGISPEKWVVNGDTRSVVPVLPLVLGGDDLTVICRGKHALRFVTAYLKAFSENTKSCQEIRRILPDGISSCAGVAVVKPHFPFSTAYDLAESLLKSAKVVKKRYSGQSMPPSAFDFYVLYDSSFIDFEYIREQLEVDGHGTRLYGGPYLVDEQSDDWGKWRNWSALSRKVEALQKIDQEGRPLIPRGQLHALREKLFLGRNSADAAYGLIKHRYPGMVELEGEPGSLFWSEGEDGKRVSVCNLIDVIEAEQFM
jgi:hypothetical protein